MTEDEIIERAWNIFPISDSEKNETFIELLVHFAKLVTEMEREQCARIADEWELAYPHPSKTIAELIRKRG